MNIRWDWLLILAAFLILGWITEASSACLLSHCKVTVTKAKTPRSYITNTHRQIVGDLYSPGIGRIQIRDTNRRIIGYVEADGHVINTSRQRIGEINE